MSTFTVTPPTTVIAGIPDETQLDLFGEDLYFFDDIQISTQGDYQTVKGMACLKQAILNRLLTAPGEYAVAPEYGVGIRQWVKKRLSLADQDNLRQQILNQLVKEDRIEKVNDIVITRVTNGDLTGISILVRVTAIGREQSFAYQVFQE